MMQSEAPSATSLQPLNGEASLESRLRGLFGEQQRLREQLERTRQELDAVNAELLRFQQQYCTDVAREEEYLNTIERILGFDPRFNLREIEEIRAGRRSCDMNTFLELEGMTQATSPDGA